MVVPSTPFLRLHFAEHSNDECYVEFVAFRAPLCSEDESTDLQNDRTRVVVASAPPPFEHQPDRRGCYQVIRLVFQGGQARWNWSYSQDAIIDEESFDWSLLPCEHKSGNYDEYDQCFDRLWRETGLCPDPSAYVVENSPWVLELSNPHRYPFEHFLICGHDSYVEVLSDSMEILPGPILEGW